MLLNPYTKILHYIPLAPVGYEMKSFSHSVAKSPDSKVRTKEEQDNHSLWCHSIFLQQNNRQLSTANLTTVYIPY
jgi:hypothetical protein